MPDHWTRASFQRATGRSRADIDRLIADGLPHDSVGSGRGTEIRIMAEPALAWLAGRALVTPGDSDALYAARTALAKVQTELGQVKLDRQRGDLVPIDAVARELDRVIAAVRAKLLGLPTKLAPVVRPDNPKLAARTLQQAMLEVLAELRTLPTMAAEEAQ